MPAQALVDKYSGDAKSLLHSVILKAKKGGFRFKNFIDYYDSYVISSLNVETGRMAFVLRNEEILRVVYDSIYNLFFDTTFARAFFGSEWEQRLIELATAKDKLQFLAQHLDDGDNYRNTEQQLH